MAEAQSILGSDGSDILNGQDGNDSLRGGAGTDTLFGGLGNDWLDGGSGNDSLQGEGGDDTLIGDEGEDTLFGGEGADLMQGGGGADTYYVDNVGDFVDDDKYSDVNTVISSVSFDLSAGGSHEINIHRLTLTGSEDLTGKGSYWERNLIIGNDGSNVLTALGAGDTLVGGAGDDRLLGTWEYDFLDGGIGSDIMDGGMGGDTYVLDNDRDVVIERADEGNGYDGDDMVMVWFTYTLQDYIEGVTLLGTEPLNAYGNRTDGTTLIGNDAANVLDTKGSSNNTIRGNGGDDYLSDGGGHAHMFGGTGDDTYEASTNSWVIEETSSGVDTVRASSFTWTLGPNFENLVLVGNSISGKGNNQANRITGNLYGNGLDGGSGADTMLGLGGDDQYYVDEAGDVVIELEGEGYDSIVTYGVSISLIGTSVERVYGENSGTLDIDITGNDADNYIRGSNGNNVIDGGRGADEMFGWGGDDVYVVDSPFDQVSEYDESGADWVWSSTSIHALMSGVENLRLQDGGIEGTGNGLKNLVEGNSSPNMLDGGDADDTLSGGAGDDTLVGGFGNDVLTGGLGRETFIFGKSGTGIDTITDFQEGEAIRIDAVLAPAPVALGNGSLLAGGRVQIEKLSDRTVVHIGTDGVQGADVRVELTGSFDVARFRVRSLGDGTSDINYPIPVPTPPTGSVQIAGETIQSRTLTASNSLVDENGIGAITYQWYAGDLAIVGATASSLVLGQAQVGKQVSVVAKYVDGLDTNESVSSKPTSVILNVDDPLSGGISLKGAPTAGSVLTTFNSFVDPDGIGEMTYEWKLDGTVLPSEQGTSITVPTDSVGKSISVTASYIDDFGTFETVTSPARVIYDPAAGGTLQGMVYHWKTHVMVPDVQISATNRNSGEVNAGQSNTDGSFALDAVAKGTYQVTAQRSASDSLGAVTSADALASLRMAVGLNPNSDPDGTGPLAAPKASPFQFISADVNADGRITSADALGILRMAVKSPSAPPAAWQFVKESVDLWDEGTNSSALSRFQTNWGQDLSIDVQDQATDSRVAVLTGDVNGSWAGQANAPDLDLTNPTYLRLLAMALQVPTDVWGMSG